MDYSKIKNATFEGVDFKDSPDFTDAYCVYAELEGEPLTDDQLYELNDSDEKHELLLRNMDF